MTVWEANELKVMVCHHVCVFDSCSIDIGKKLGMSSAVDRDGLKAECDESGNFHEKVELGLVFLGLVMFVFSTNSSQITDGCCYRCRRERYFRFWSWCWLSLAQAQLLMAMAAAVECPVSLKSLHIFIRKLSWVLCFQGLVMFVFSTNCLQIIDGCCYRC